MSTTHNTMQAMENIEDTSNNSGWGQKMQTQNFRMHDVHVLIRISVSTSRRCNMYCDYGIRYRVYGQDRILWALGLQVAIKTHHSRELHKMEALTPCHSDVLNLFVVLAILVMLRWFLQTYRSNISISGSCSSDPIISTGIPKLTKLPF